MTVCRYYLQGNCRFGNRCRFEHTDPNKSNTYYDSYEHSNYHQDRGRQQPAYTNYDNSRERQYYDSYSQMHQSFDNSYRNPKYALNYNEEEDENYYANKYQKNKLQWMSPDYKKQMEQKTTKPSGGFFKTSTPKSKTSFSFKDAEVRSTHQPDESLMNEKNIMDAEFVKEDVLLWEFGGQWPFTCYCLAQGKSMFPGFFDISPEELRFEAYKAKENNTFNLYVESVEKALQDIKMKQNQLKEPSVQLMTMLEKIRRGEDLSSDSIDGTAPSLAIFSHTTPESMVADQTLPQSTAASFSFSTTPASFFGSKSSAASSFSFKTTLDGDTAAKSSASSFSFKLPTESGFKPDTNGDIYTALDKLSEQEREQFLAPTFTLGKIPTVPPPQSMCI